MSSTDKAAVVFGSVGAFLQPRLSNTIINSTIAKMYFFIKGFRLRLKKEDKNREIATSYK